MEFKLLNATSINNLKIRRTMSRNDDIKAINEEAVHKICSGQVILSLAIAVKELVENAIDAGAKIIEIRVKNYGLDALEVVDNGSGIDDQNFNALALKHHTSKIREFSDLEKVGTLGFRGEALSSLCALADLTVTTRHESAECGTKLEFDHYGHIKTQSLSARSVGTSVQLTNLFISLPVRRKEFHKNYKKEFHKMCSLLHAYCLICTDIKFTCSNQIGGSKNLVLSTQALGSITDNIINIFGPKQSPNLFEVALVHPDEATANDYGVKNLPEESSFRFHFYISSVMHGCGRSSADRQFFYINSRPCEPQRVAKLVNETYKMFNAHQYPFVLLNILVLSSYVDVNVTPDKRQIYLEQEKLLLATIRMSLIQAFKNFPCTYTDLSQVNSTQEASNISKRKINDAADGIKTFLDSFRKKSKLSSTSSSYSEPSETEDFEVDKIACPLTPNKVFTRKVSLACQTTEKDTLKSLINSEKEDEKKLEMNAKPRIIKSIDLSIDDKIIDLSSPARKDISETETCKTKALVAQEKPSEDADVFDSPRSNAWNAFKQKTSLNFTLDAIRKMVHEQEAARNANQSLTVKFRCDIAPQSNKDAENELEKQFQKEMFKQMDIIGQFNHAFIIASVDHDVFIIDQHACDEKYNFEVLQKITVINSQTLVNPKPLNLTSVDESILLENEEVFNNNGFHFEHLPEEPATKRIRLTKIPVSTGAVFGIDDIEEMIYMLKEGSDAHCRPSRIRGIFALRACRMSVMVGKALDRSAMRKHVDRMGDLEQPWNCPHGRPTMRHLINLRLIE